jgi:hypothetical protein
MHPWAFKDGPNKEAQARFITAMKTHINKIKAKVAEADAAALSPNTQPSTH